jgi:hypothetical protein
MHQHHGARLPEKLVVAIDSVEETSQGGRVNA